MTLRLPTLFIMISLTMLKNKKAELEYETSKYPGTDVNSYFVIRG